MKRWRGLAQLVVQGVVAGSAAIERVQKETAAVPFGILEALPVLGPPARTVHALFDGAVGATHAAVRTTAGVVGKTVEVVLEEVERRAGPG